MTKLRKKDIEFYDNDKIHVYIAVTNIDDVDSDSLLATIYRRELDGSCCVQTGVYLERPMLKQCNYKRISRQEFAEAVAYIEHGIKDSWFEQEPGLLTTPGNNRQ